MHTIFEEDIVKKVQISNFLSSVFAPKFRTYSQRWFAKKLDMILRNGFPYFISTFLEFEKIRSNQLFIQNRDLGASLTVPPQKRHSRLCVTISPFRFLETKKRKNVFNFYHVG